MAIEAPYSKFKLKNYKIYALVCIVGAIILAYDGYLSKYEWSKRQGFYNKHVDSEGKIDDMMKTNRNAPLVLLPLAAGFVVRFFMVKNRKIVADEQNLVFGKRTIILDNIEKIDRTHFKKKGYFTIFYKDEKEGDCQLKLSDRTYDNLNEMLDHIVKKMTA